METKKICTKCGKDLSIKDFHKNKTKNDGLQAWCKTCKSKLSSERYKNKTEHIKKLMRLRKTRIQNFIRNYKSSRQCEICGTKGYWKLVFHHPDKKEYNIAEAPRLGYSIKRILKEIKKCMIVCHNCHADIHHNKNL